jgi:uncharacterized protein DUF748
LCQVKAMHAPAGVTISTIELKDGNLNLYDATVSRPPLKTTIVQIDAVIKDVTAPATERTRFDFTGIVKGVRRDGRAKISVGSVRGPGILPRA